MDLLNNIKTIWNRINVVQRAVIMAAIMACGIMSVVLTGWASKADMRPLFLGLSLEEAGRVTDKLTELGIEFELKGNGTSVYISQDRLYTTRIELAKEGLPEADKGGYKIFENSKISASPLVQQMNHKQALEEELAKSIQMIQGVEYARILIVTPDQSLFTKSDTSSKASVSVKLKAGWQLSRENIAAITNLTSSAIEGLTPSNVTIVDSNGKLLSVKEGDSFAQGANTYQEYKQSVENALSKKALEMLETVLGAGRATVKVSADIDMTSVTTQTTEYDNKGVPTKESINSTTRTKSTPVAAKGNDGPSVQPSSVEKEEQNETEMLVGKVITNKVQMPGKINALTVAVVVDLSIPAGLTTTATPAPDQTTGDPSENQHKIMTVDQVKEIIRNALGRDLLNDDSSLSVVDAPFMQTRISATPIPEMSSSFNLNNYVEIIKNSSMPIMGLFAFLTVLVMSKTSKKAKSSSSSSASSEISSSKLKEGDTASLLAAAKADDSPELVYRNHISSSLRENPDQVKQLFAAWVRED